MSKTKVVAVSYYNTLPMLYGLERSEYIKENVDLQLAYPSECARLLLNKEVDVALVPTGIIPKLKISYIVSKYCIGAEGKVASVLLCSNVPIEKIRSVYLDYQSATSVRLVKILAKHFWHISPEWKPAMPGYEMQINGDCAGVIIGDRCFVHNSFKYTYDLAEEWIKFSSLPFVFATWIAVRPVDSEFKKQFNNALQEGVSNIPAVIDYYKDRFIKGFDPYKYYTENISYFFSEQKSRGMNIFLKYVRIENQEDIIKREMLAQY